MINIAKPAYAIICNPALGNLGCAPSATPEIYFNKVLQTSITILIIIAVLFFVWHLINAGLRMINSQGDPKNFETGKNQLLYAVVGLIVVFSIFAILKLVGTITGIQGLEQLNLTLPTL